jgi:hypothetical protein
VNPVLEDMNHAVQAVGFGSAGKFQYVILRNQWDTTWGDEGYMKLAMDDSVGGVCGLYMYVVVTDVGSVDIGDVGYTA